MIIMGYDYHRDDIYSLETWFSPQNHLFRAASSWPYCFALLRTKREKAMYLMLINGSLKPVAGKEPWYYHWVPLYISENSMQAQMKNMKWGYCNINSCSSLYAIFCPETLCLNLYLGHKELNFPAEPTLRLMQFFLSAACMHHSSTSWNWKIGYVV